MRRRQPPGLPTKWEAAAGGAAPPRASQNDPGLVSRRRQGILRRGNATHSGNAVKVRGITLLITGSGHEV